eukprot:768657-Hanusia_phi.AAC.4
MKFPDKQLQDWTPLDNNPLELIRNCINTDTCSFSKDFFLQCKVSQVYDLDNINPVKSAIENVKTDIKNNMQSYVDATGISVLSPIYIVLIQYPNKWDTNGKDIKGYHYSQFDIEDIDPKPCVRRDILKDEYTVCNQADTKMIVVYPMYSRNKDKLYDYGVIDDRYNINLSDDIKSSLKPNLNAKPNFKGIVDMIKFFGRYASKNQLCFVECNNDSSLVCGCATRRDGVDDPITDPKGVYKSFCKAPYDPKDDTTKYNFSHYAFMYRVNERENIINKDSFSNYITDVNIDAETEKKINEFILK